MAADWLVAAILDRGARGAIWLRQEVPKPGPVRVRPQGVGTGNPWNDPTIWCPGGFSGMANTASGSVMVWDQPFGQLWVSCGQNGEAFIIAA